MDIAGISTALSNLEVMPGIGTAVLAKAMDTNEQLSSGMVEMMEESMELSVNPSVGANIDVRI